MHRFFRPQNQADHAPRGAFSAHPHDRSGPTHLAPPPPSSVVSGTEDVGPAGLPDELAFGRGGEAFKTELNVEVTIPEVSRPAGCLRSAEVFLVEEVGERWLGCLDPDP